MMNPTRELPSIYVLKSSFDLTHNVRLAILLNVLGAGLLFFFAWVFLEITRSMRPEFLDHINLEVSSIGDLLVLVGVLLAVTVVMVVVHEGVHGFFFWRITHQRPAFGYRGYYAYACAPGWYIPRNPYLVVSLSPFILISIVGVGLLAIVPYGLIPAMLLLVAMNAAGAIGDLIVSIWLFTKPEYCLIQDFGDKVSLYSPGD
jgi:hypothetical protein